MAERITLKKNDRVPSIVATIKDKNGTVIDLTAASTVTFSMRNQYTGACKINAAAASFVAPRTTGQVKYDWLAGDTDTADDYIAEFTVVWVADNKKQTAPQTTNLFISIFPTVV